MLAAMTHPSRVLNLDMKAKLCMPKSYIYIYIYVFFFFFKFRCHGIQIQNGQASCTHPHSKPTGKAVVTTRF